MKSFFEDERRFNALQSEIQRWKGTPSRPHQGRPGVGTDCVRFVHGVLKNIGALPEMEWPPYVTRGGGEQMLHLCRSTILGLRGVTPIWAEGDNESPFRLIQRGDFLLISTGKALHHLVLVEQPPTVWHCFKEVTSGSMHDSVVANHLKNVFRILHHGR